MTEKSPDLTNVWRDPWHFIAFGFGLGLARLAPGTFGTLAAIPIYLILINFNLITYISIVLILTVFGCWVCGKVSRDLGVHDYSGIVWDEVVGYLVTMIAVPVNIGWMVLGFVLFRIFDIWKPWPIGWIDRKVKGGIGIVIDDIIAAIYAGILLQLVLFVVTSQQR